MPDQRRRVADFCVDAEVPELDNDVGTGREGDVEARCFSESNLVHITGWHMWCWLRWPDADLMLERDSPRDQLVVTFFVLTVVALLLFAAIGSRSVEIGVRRDVYRRHGDSSITDAMQNAESFGSKRSANRSAWIQ